MHKQGFHLNLLNLKDKRRMTHFFRDLSLIFGVTSILLLCVYSIICCLTKELMTVFLQNGIFLHHLSFYLLKPDSNRYCGSVMNTDTHMSNRYFFFLYTILSVICSYLQIYRLKTHILYKSHCISHKYVLLTFHFVTGYTSMVIICLHALVILCLWTSMACNVGQSLPSHLPLDQYPT